MANAQKLLDSINKKYGEGTMMRASEVPVFPAIHSGSFALDYAIGIGGLPQDRTVEIGGGEGCGKTTLALLSLVQFLKDPTNADRAALILDMEHKLTMSWVRELIGDELMDSDRVLYVQPDHIEQATNIFVDLVSTGEVAFVLYDSIGGSAGKAVIEKEAEKAQVGGDAKAIGRLLNLANIYCSKYRCLGLFINQERDDMDGYRRYMTPGGRKAKYMFILRIRLKASTKAEDKIIRKINGEDRQIGTLINATIMKNQLAAPFRSAKWNMYNVWTEEFGFGIDTTEEVVRLGTATGVIQGSGWYTHPAFPDNGKGEHKLQGMKGVQAAVKADPVLRDTLVSEILAALKGDEELAAAIAPIDTEAAEMMAQLERQDADA
ncbi:UvsX-like recombinase [Mycobacterium phage Phabba]|uniref:RecA-like DNA recombinase n=1 Tax=Mycobacterium phage Phabba TaxID=2027899 RepID=A0A249XSN0_9CAUD|nr:UvsX-like recombinase [Mycobacterium phage Phabba]ASZ74743.1 RecA-like DNA recombinase [Mycobacterium phage Phabba]